MRSALIAITILTSVLLVIVILLQNQGSGLGTAFGGDSGFYRTKRGAERVLFYLTVALATGFVASLVGLLVVR